MLLTVKSIRIKRMNVEIFCERRSQERGGVRKGVWHCFWGVRRGVGAQGIVFGAFARARNACMIVFATDVRFFCKFEFYVHIHYYF